MEESNMVNGGKENGSTSEGRPPNPLAAASQQCLSATRVSSTCKKTLLRHPSLAKALDTITIEPLSLTDCVNEFLPIVRSGAWTDIGIRSRMEDVYVCVDDFMHHYGLEHNSEGPNAFYGVFDGHGGKHAYWMLSLHLVQLRWQPLFLGGLK